MIRALIALVIWFNLSGARPPAPSAPEKSRFKDTVQPILQQHCQPCHFPGGKMYARLPFDRPETIIKLGTKLFSRIRDEKERDVIRKFLARQGSYAAPSM